MQHCLTEIPIQHRTNAKIIRTPTTNKFTPLKVVWSTNPTVVVVVLLISVAVETILDSVSLVGASGGGSKKKLLIIFARTYLIFELHQLGCLVGLKH